jgi:hypothetical membrane protein
MYDPNNPLHAFLSLAAFFAACAIVGYLALIAHDKRWRFDLRMLLLLMAAVALFSVVMRYWLPPLAK